MKKYGIAVAVSILLSLAVVAVTLMSIPDVTIPQESIDGARSMINYVRLTPVNASLSHSLRYRVQDEDPQLFIENIHDEIGALVVDFKNKLPEGTWYQLYYAKSDEGLSEANSIRGRTDESTDILAIRLPEFAQYDTFRLDIDMDYQLENIAVIDDAAAAITGKSALSVVLDDPSRFPVKHFLICLAILLCEALLVAWKWDAIKRCLTYVWRGIRDNRKALEDSALIVLCCVLIGFDLWLVLYKTGHCQGVNKFTIYCFLSGGLAAGLLIAMRRQFHLHPERGFLIIALFVGMLFAVGEPAATYFSWDDQTHYAKVVRLSYGDSDYISVAERIVSYLGVSSEMTLHNKEASAHYVNHLPYRGFGGSNNMEMLSYNVIPAYLPSAAAIWLARTAGVSMSNTLILGRLSNLLCYVLVVYFAIKQLKFGKLFAIALGLIPETLFLAANYSYDPFCISFIMLGVCVWLGVYQRPERKMTGWRAAGMLIAFAMGILAKAVYFPFMLVVIFLPADRFDSKAAARRYRVAVVLTAVLLAASFAVPFLFSRGTAEKYNDIRGGSGISAGNQAAFILKNPLIYLGILMRFLFTRYFTAANILSPSNGALRAFAYISAQNIVFPNPPTWAMLALMLAAWVVSFDVFDRRGQGVPLWVKAIACVLAFGAISVAATSLYCAFTPVGSPSINGFQERYMLPIVVPLLLILRPTLLTRRLEKLQQPKWLNQSFLFVEGAVLLVGMWPYISRFLG